MPAKKKATTKKRAPTNEPLLIEIGTEELPPKALKRISEAFGEHVFKGLVQAHLVDEGAAYRVFAAPRRLAVRVFEVRRRQPDRQSERRGPALNAAFDAEGRPTKAAQGFAGSCGVAVDELERFETSKGSWLVYRSQEKGRPAAELIPGVIDDAVKKLPVPKRMRWGDLDTEFIRPVHWLVVLHGKNVVKTELLSVKADRKTRGHRFHHPKPIALTDASAYEDALAKRGHVVVDFDERRARIRRDVEKLAAREKGKAQIDEALLDEVTSLVEWPHPLMGGFDQSFLDVPAEALVTTMRDNQKYFAVTTPRGRLLPHFITVANIKSKDAKRIRRGNERVLRARFSDAKFFWETDRKTSLEDRVPDLDEVVFHIKLGSLHQKVGRVAQLAGEIAEALGGDRMWAERAAHLAKADLMTGMVGEFPELQGTMGRYYAKHDGEPAEVAAAMEEQYLPRFAGDKLPATNTGKAVAIADKLDTLVGIFGVGEVPTGDKDPFALRRAALGVLRIMIERKLDLDLRALLASAVRNYELSFESGGVVDEVYGFMMERLRAYYSDAGIGADVFEAVLSRSPARPLDFDKRVRAVMAFRKLPQAESLTTANKRIRNILRQAGDFAEIENAEHLLVAEEERELARAVAEMQGVVEPCFAEGDYTTALKRMADLREPVDTFFDEVMVMVDDGRLRNARLQLLKGLSDMFLRVADLSKLQG
jgi:glycyl-tRNA synthetase beta chain